MVSERVNQIETSPTLKVSAKAAAMKAQGIDIADLSVGEPDFPTPSNVKKAGIAAIEQNFTKYTANEGIPALKKAVIDRIKEDTGLDYGLNEVIVSTGGKSSIYHLLQALVNPGDEVIIPAPYWVTYPESVKLAGGKPVIIPTKDENGFLLTQDELKAAISPSTRALILNNPSNPTGAAYSRRDLEALAAVIREEDLFVIADEMYGKLVYDDFLFTSFASLGDDIKKKTILVNGVSKAYSMTGWRIGYALGPAQLIAGMAKIQSHSTSNPCSISQKAALEALSGDQHEVQRMVSEFQRRRNYVLMRLGSIPNISCFKSQGAFYLFPNVSQYYNKEAGGTVIRNSYGLAYYLLKEGRVAIVPGGAFGADHCIRISYSTSMENLEKGMDRIAEAMSKLKAAAKDKRVSLQNTVTRVRKPVPVDPSIDIRMRDGLASESERHLGFENSYEWNASINGAVVQLRTNVAHLNDFWMENFYPAQLEAGLEPHGLIYAVDGIPGREPRGYYNSETKTGFLVNTDHYGSLRSLAMGLVIDISERLFGVHSVRGMSADFGGNGLILVGPPGTGKTELFFGLLQNPGFRIHSNDLIFVRLSGKNLQADCAERKFYLPTETVELAPRLAPLFDASKCENVVMRRENCRDAECLRGDDCRLDRGSTYCYRAAKDAHAMLDPNWLGGPAAYAKRTGLRWVFLLRNDSSSPAVSEIAKEEALRILEAGESIGITRSIGPDQGRPFFNPHLLIATPERLELQKAFFGRLLENVRFYLFNSGAAGAEKIIETVTSAS